MEMSSRVIWGIALLLLCGVNPPLSLSLATRSSQATSSQATPSSPAEASKDLVPQTESPELALDSEREVLDFVGLQQPKLLKLLEFLKAKQPEKYDQALKDTERTMQRLRSLKKRDEELYQVELDLWRTRSRLRLLAAEIAVATEARRAELEPQLEQLIQLEVQQNVKRLMLLKSNAEKQVAKYSAQIQEHTENQTELVDKSLKNWTNRIKRLTRD